MKVITYSRVSTDDKWQNPAVQSTELKRYCAARGWEITDEVIDHGYSGGTDQRPGLKRLLSKVRAREVDAVVVIKLDRLFRGLKHLVATLEEFNVLGITFVAIKDNVDYSTPAGRFFVQILGSFAEFEKSLLRERTIMGLIHAKSMGKKLGRRKTTNDSAIVTLHNSGYSYRTIQQRLSVSAGAVWRALNSAPKTPSKP
ncbi:MAG: recombinase family protein [Bdellovibrionales bacterium]|nr:recombinase family protein [Bdellovibrionales bacterium]